MFTVEGINVIRSDYGVDADDFSILVHCEISQASEHGGEAFTATVVSPKRLMNASNECPLLGHGLIITNEFQESQIIDAIRGLIEQVTSWNELTHVVSRYFDWIE